MEPLLKIGNRTYSKTSHGVFEVPLRDLYSLRFTDVPYYSTVEIADLPGISDSYQLAISATHAGGPSNEEFFIDYHVTFYLDIEQRDRFRLARTSERRIQRIQKAFASLVQAGLVAPPTENRHHFHNKWYCGLHYSRYFDRADNPVLSDAIASFIGAFNQLIRTRECVLFLCHASEDKPFVDELARFLDRAGTDIWYDRREIKVGESIVQKIKKGLDEATHLVVICSKVSVTKPWVRKELSSALMRQLHDKSISVLPVLFEDCELPSLLADIRYADCRQNHEFGFEELINGVLG